MPDNELDALTLESHLALLQYRESAGNGACREWANLARNACPAAGRLRSELDGYHVVLNGPEDVVEAVAEAMYEEAESTTHGGWYVSWGKAHSSTQDDYRYMARAALKALRKVAGAPDA